MSNVIMKMKKEKQDRTRASDITWALGYLIASIMLVLVWATFRPEAAVSSL